MGFGNRDLGLGNGNLGAGRNEVSNSRDCFVFMENFTRIILPVDSIYLKTIQKTTQKTDRKIIECIKNNPYISRVELSELCNISQDGIKWQLRKMQKENIIRRVGPDKGGYWEII